MANADNPGGGVWSGRAAQEEDLCRRTDLAFHTTGWRGKSTRYPLKFGKFVCHRGVLACRAGKETGHAELKTKFRVDMVSMAARRNPKVDIGDYLLTAEAKKCGSSSSGR
jgi:hypothetical protein